MKPIKKAHKSSTKTPESITEVTEKIALLNSRYKHKVSIKEGKIKQKEMKCQSVHIVEHTTEIQEIMLYQPPGKHSKEHSRLVK